MKNNIITIIVLVALAAGGYYYSQNKKQAEALLTSTTKNSPEATIGKDFLGILNQLKTLNLDDGVFKDPAFKSLRDQSVELPDLPIGRGNPFAPIHAVLPIKAKK